MTSAVFFDVDFTLIYPGPSLQAEGYKHFCARHGVTVDPRSFSDAVASASSLLEEADDHEYDPELFVNYTRSIIEAMGGQGAGVEASAREIYDEWAACHRFSLYDDVEPALRQLAAAGVRVGLISNTHRSLSAFESHFELDGLIAGAISSSQHGYMKPHPSIFQAALRLLDVPANESIMVGDSLKHDIEGARAIGMRGVLVCRSRLGRRSAADPSAPRAGRPHHTPFADPGDEHLREAGIPVIASLAELAALL